MFSKIPFLSYVKLAGVLAMIAGCLYTGFHFGKSEGDRNAALAKVETSAAKEELANTKRVHAEEMTILQGRSVVLIQEAVAANTKLFKEENRKLKVANEKYQTRINELSAASLAASSIAVTRGMWIDVKIETCKPRSSNSHGVGDAKEGIRADDLGGFTTSRCQLTDPASGFLISLASESDLLAEKFNLCRSEIRTVNVGPSEGAVKE